MLCAAENLEARPSRRPHGCPSVESSHLDCSRRRMQPHSSSVMHNSTALSHSRPPQKPGGKDDAKRKANRLFLLLGLGSLDLCRAPEGLLSVLALLACGRTCQRGRAAEGCGETNAVVCWHARPWWRGQHGRVCSWAQTSSSPRASRRRGRSQWSCHHRTVCGGQRR